MQGIGLEVTLVFLLVVANGVFSMAEMAVVSARKARLRQRAEEGSKGAAAALALGENPNDFLSTVQVGITMIGTLAGAFGGATIAEKLAVSLKQIPAVAPYADSASIGLVVLVITYLSLIVGELVPKSLALGNPEAIASALAPPMRSLARLGSPAVRFLTFSTRMVLKILPVSESQEAPVTEDEIKSLIAQGTQHGTFHATEQEMVEGVFRLGDHRVDELLRPRNRLVWLDAEDSWPVNEAKILKSGYSRFLVAEGGLDRLIGVVHVRGLFAAALAGNVDLRAVVQPPLFVPETSTALRLLGRFRETGEQLAVVIDEHGGVEGIVTFADLTDAIVGSSGVDTGKPGISPRGRDGWLADGSLPIPVLLEELDLRDLPGEKDDFNTVAGFVLAHLEKIPAPGDRFSVDGWTFEVVDMDGNRVDKVLIGRGPG